MNQAFYRNFPPLANMPVIAPVSEYSIGQSLMGWQGIVGGAAWPVSNTAYFIPFEIQQPFLVKLMAITNENTVSGNVDVGVYAEDGTRLISKGSTAQSGTFSNQTLDVTDTVLAPGKYYLAMAMDNTTGIVGRLATGLERLKTVGILEMATAFPLPAVATFATLTTNYCPMVCISNRSFI